MKKYISILLVTCLIISMLSVLSLRCYAEVPASQKVTKISSTWTGYPFGYTFHSAYFYINDSTGIPTSTPTEPIYFYTEDNTTFQSVDGSDLMTLVFNLGIHVIFNPTNLRQYDFAFWDAIGAIKDSGSNKFVQGGLYDSNENFLGYVLNDISNCYWYQLPPSNDITIPDEFVDDVKNFTDYYLTNIPDFFTFYTFSKSTVLRYNQQSPALTQADKDFVNNYADNKALFYDTLTSSGKHELYAFNSNDGLTLGKLSGDISYGVAANVSDYNAFCDRYEITEDLLATDLSSIAFTGSGKRLNVNYYDSNANALTMTYVNSRGLNTTSNQNTYIGNYYPGINSVNNSFFTMPFNQDITIYKNATIKTNLDDRTYEKDIYYTEGYDDYNQYNDNSITTTLNTVDNSIQYNSDIYNDSNDTFYNYYDNGYYDQSSATNNITNITNNYYNNNDPDNPDNPDNPENPDDNNTLDAILAAILRFFNAIGDIIGTILAGLVNMISAVLESIAELTSDITNLSDVFGSLLAWLPDPVPQVLGVGLSLVIIAGVIKFIRG